MSLALAIVSALNLMAVFAHTDNWPPARKILGHWFSSSSLEAVAPAVVGLAKVGANLMLPASVLLAVFFLAGFHRKTPGPRGWVMKSTLTFMWLFYVFLTTAPIFFKGVSLFVTSLALAPVLFAMPVIAPFALILEIQALVIAKTVEPSPASPRVLVAWVLLPPLLAIAPLFLVPSNPMAMTARQDEEFAALCKDAVVKLMAKPAGPVHSIAYEGGMGSPPDFERIRLDPDGRIVEIGGWPQRGSVEATKKVELDFTERPHPLLNQGRALAKGDAPYYRIPGPKLNEKPYGVDSISADVVVRYEVSDANELKKAPIAQNAIRYRLTLADRRSGQVLGEFVFVVDRANNRGCGANIEDVISIPAFYFDAFNR